MRVAAYKAPSYFITIVTKVIFTLTKTCQYSKKQVSVSEIFLTKLWSHNDAHTNYYTYILMNDTWKNISPFGENILSNQNVFLLRVHRELVLVRVCVRVCVRGILWGNSILNVILNFAVIRIFMLFLVLISWMFSDRLLKTTRAPHSLQLLPIHSPDLVRE